MHYYRMAAAVAAADAVGGGGSEDGHFAALDISADATYPRTFSSAVDTIGGLIWFKRRDSAATHNLLVPDGATDYSATFVNASTPAAAGNVTRLVNGFTVDSYSGGSDFSVNSAGDNVLWLFKKQPGFMDIVNYTGDGTVRTIPHDLGQVPGMMIFRQLNAPGNWNVFHKASAALPWRTRLRLEAAGGAATELNALNDTAPTDTEFTLGTATPNASGVRMAAILIADDASPEGVSRCGSYAGNGSASGPTIELGWNPRFVLIKRPGATSNWLYFDTTRTPGFSGNEGLLTQATSAETGGEDYLALTGSGFQVISTLATINNSGTNYIFWAVR